METISQPSPHSEPKPVVLKHTPEYYLEAIGFGEHVDTPLIPPNEHLTGRDFLQLCKPAWRFISLFDRIPEGSPDREQLAFDLRPHVAHYLGLKITEESSSSSQLNNE